MLQKNVLEYLENTARRFPDKLAFSDEGRSFSFAQLLAAAKGLGSALAAQTDRPNRPVVVLVDHRAANLAAFQGVLSAGDYYVPLDSQMPLPRLRGIVETLAPAALVYGQARERVAQALADLCPVLLLDEAAFTHSVDEARLQCRRDRVLDIDPVYAIFTSGSTGTPKGIILSHRSVIDFIEWMADACGFTERDILANQAPFYFDLSVGPAPTSSPRKTFSSRPCSWTSWPTKRSRPWSGRPPPFTWSPTPACWNKRPRKLCVP